MTNQNRTAKTEGNVLIPMYSEDLRIRNKLPFLGHIANKSRRPTIPQLNIKGPTASKMNVFYYLALQFEALVLLLQDTHCINAENLVLPGYQLAATTSLRRAAIAAIYFSAKTAESGYSRKISMTILREDAITATAYDPSICLQPFPA